MRSRPSGRRGVAPIIAELILIAITLTTAAALSTYFFGLIGTYASPATMSIQPSSVFCAAPGGSSVSLPDGAPVPPGECGMTVFNSGTAPGTIAGAGPQDSFPGLVAPSYSIPADGHGDVFMRTTAAAGFTLSGYLEQADGPDLLFSVVVQ